MADETQQTGSDEGGERKPDSLVTYWLDQLEAYHEEFKSWETRCKKIIRRYRDERQADSDGTPQPAGDRFNALWSNVQTLQPAIYIKPPQPITERRFLDKDPLARISSMTLERSLEVQIEVGYLHPSMQKAVLDYLLTGRGATWERYEPTYGAAQVATGTGQGGEDAPRPVTYEKVCTDYVAWNKFRHSPSAIWEEVWWVGKEELLTRKELRARFKGKDPQTGKLIADLIPLRQGSPDKENDREKKRKQPRACIWEIWDKVEREVIFIAPDWTNAPVEVTSDPLGLETFWPCPKPLYATTTNDCLVPVPDYVEYQDQADELDNLTSRIQALTDAVRVNGVYDASYPELKRILSEGVDNRMIGVKNYAEFASKGGLEKALDFVPIKDVVEALIRLYEARDRVKADMAEITGLSDIIRGQAQGTAKTATEQRIKGQFATLRLEDRKKEVARFCRDTIHIKAEIISEQFAPEILAEMTGMIPFIADELKAEAPPLQPAQQPMMGHNGGPPLTEPGASPSPVDGAAGGMPSAPGQQPPMQPPPPPDFQAMAMQRFMQAVELLKNDKMRTFRIDIETDSTIEVDKQAAKEAVTEMTTAVGALLEKSIPIVQMVPQLVTPIGQTLLMVMRRFGAGRDVEAAWEAAIDQLTQASKNPAPKPPSPEQVKAQAEKQKQEMETQRMQMQAQIDQQKAQMELQAQQQKNAMEMQKMQAELQMQREEMQMMRQKLGMELQAEQQRQALDAQAAERDAALSERAAIRDDEMAERAAERDAEMGETKFELDKKTMAAKAKEASKPKPNGGARK